VSKETHTYNGDKSHYTETW